MTAAPLRILTFTTLFPSSTRPRHGIFVETRLSAIRKCAKVEFTVVAPVPWYPLGSSFSDVQRTLSQTPRCEVRGGVPVHHPRYFNLPGTGMYTAPVAIAQAANSTVEEIKRRGFDFDLVDAHYFYPDG